MTSRRPEDVVETDVNDAVETVADQEDRKEPCGSELQGSSAPVRDPLAEAEAMRDEYLELAQRVQADFEN